MAEVRIYQRVVHGSYPLDNPAPPGYFNVLAEMARLVLIAERNGLQSNWATVPDISAGSVWAKHWVANGLDDQYGERTRYNHYYPSHYRQSDSNPQQALAYPLEALGAFQIWLQTTYAQKHFPKYLMDKVRKKAIDREEATALIAVLRANSRSLRRSRPKQRSLTHERPAESPRRAPPALVIRSPPTRLRVVSAVQAALASRRWFGASPARGSARCRLGEYVDKRV